MNGTDYLCRHCLKSRPSRFLAGLLACALALSFGAIARAQTSVTTYHNDPQRTGWNPSEAALTPANVTPTTFGLIASVALDDEVDAQPLVVANQTIKGQGVHTVVYVVTESNTVYAIDSLSGKILLPPVNLGAPVPSPGGCSTQPSIGGILSTPTIDVAKQKIYLMAYTLVSGQATFKLHALNLQTLQDGPGSPINVSASHTLANGSSTTLNPAFQRQRPALLESSGNIYAAFGAACPNDFRAGHSRGWLLGWNAGTLAALGANEVTDTLATARTNISGENYFLSSIWMSGYGVAADAQGNVFFTTGNSDPFHDTYTGTTNIQESAVKMPPALTSVLDLFTPANVFTLDLHDTDYSGGGILVLPDQPGPVPDLAVASGKDGRLFILNRDDMGGFHDPDIPAYVSIGSCHCGESYYQGSDGVGRVVSSGGNVLKNGEAQSQAKTWTVNTARSPALTFEASSLELAETSQDPGFFTSVSSNGTTPKTAIIWGIGRPTGSHNQVTLYAFNGTAHSGTLAQLWSGSAGSWPELQHNANLVPTVANGMVYVGSFKQLAIFGLTTASTSKAELQVPAAPPTVKPQGAQFWGTINSIHGSRLIVALRTGKLLQVDLSEAFKKGTTDVPLIGRNVAVTGKLNAQGVLDASFMWRAKGPKSWGADSRG
jgi:hypothetical protein